MSYEGSLKTRNWNRRKIIKDVNWSVICLEVKADCQEKQHYKEQNRTVDSE